VVGKACLRRETLNSIIADTESRNQRTGYLNIDCEGHDLEVLKGFDLALYQPTIITIETPDQAIESTLNYLLSAGYVHKETLKWILLFVREDPKTNMTPIIVIAREGGRTGDAARRTHARWTVILDMHCNTSPCYQPYSAYDLE
jgi:hypothetical protein